MYNKDNEFLDNSRDNGISMINSKPEMQLKIIQHFLPQAELNKAFKTHEEKTPSSRLKLDGTKYWLKNFGAGKKAVDWLNITQEKLACDTREALDYINRHIIIRINPSPNTESSYSPFERRLFAIKNNQTKRAKEYLAGRCIEVDKLPQGCFYQSKKIDGTYEIVFIDSQEQLINIRALGHEKGEYYNNGKLNNALYDKLYKPEEELVFLTEGCINALSIHEHSVLAFFSAENLFTDYKKLKPYLDGKTVVLAFDNDDAGNKLNDRILSLMLKYEFNIKVIFQLNTPEKKDLNNLLEEGILNDLLESNESYIQLFPKLLENSQNIEEDIVRRGFYKKDHCYYMAKSNSNRSSHRRVSNFIMEVSYFLPKGSDDSSRVFYLQNVDGESQVICIRTKKLKLSEFNTAIGHYGNFWFKGRQNDLIDILEDEFRFLKVAHEINVNGQQEGIDIYAMSNGVIDKGVFREANKYGMVDIQNKTYLLPAYSSFNKYSGLFDDDRNIYYQKGEANFSKWSSLFYKAHNKNSMIGISYTIACVFRDIIFRKLRFFPFLYLFGDQGSGKTTFANCMLKLFYRDYDGISIEGASTTKAIARSVHNFRNGLVFLKEFTNNIEPELTGLMKTGYDGSGHSRATYDNSTRTHSTKFNSGLVVDSNVMPHVSSLHSRFILLIFGTDIFTLEQSNAIEELEQLFESGFGKVLQEIISYRSYFERKFPGVFEEVKKELNENSEFLNVSARSKAHLALLLSVYKVLNSKLNFPFVYIDLYNYAKEVIVEQDNDVTNSSRINRYWEILDNLKAQGELIEGVHYRFASRNKGQTYLALSLHLIHPIYRKNIKSFEGEDIAYKDLQKLIVNDPAFIPSWMSKGGDAINVKFSGSTQSAYAFDINNVKLNIELWQK